MPTMTATEMIPAVGQTVGVRFEQLTVTCRVSDVKDTWGQVKVLITPLDGDGSQWVTLSRVIRKANRPPVDHKPWCDEKARIEGDCECY